MIDSVSRKMLATIRRLHMIEPQDTVLVAVSGGPDSITLLHALKTLADELQISLHAAHLNHGIRGKESDEDAEYVELFSKNIGVPCTVEKIDVPQIRRVTGLSEEEAARLMRYEFLERKADEIGANRIAVGHTADDQVETVWLNLIRGAGLDGLAGMPSVRGRIIRPLIEVRRSEIEVYVELHGLRPRVDFTNLLPSYTRNRVRLQLLPFLRREFNPEIDEAVLRLAELARVDSTYLNNEAETRLLDLIKEEQTGWLFLDATALMTCPEAIQRRVMRLAIIRVRGELTNIGLIHVTKVLELLAVGKDFVYDLPGGIHIIRRGTLLSISSETPKEILVSYCRELTVPGETPIPEIDAVIRTKISSEPINFVRPPQSLEIVADLANVKGKLRARNWHHGDYVRPLGMMGTKKVQDIFVDAKIPRDIRHRIPIVTDDEKIVWVAGLVMSDLVKVTASTHEYLTLSLSHTQSCSETHCVV